MIKKRINKRDRKKFLLVIGKKGMMDDLFDLFFTVFASIFLLLFISAALTGGIKNSNEKSLKEVADFKQIDSAINNLRVLLYEGEDLEKINIDEMINKSKILGGRTITTCHDYTKETDCITDPIKVGEGNCRWFDDECLTLKG